MPGKVLRALSHLCSCENVNLTVKIFGVYMQDTRKSGNF